MEKARDDVKGGELPIGKVKEARREEMVFIQGRKLWDLKPVEECWEKLGKPLLSMRWVDTNKGWLKTSRGERSIGMIYLLRHHLWKPRDF